MKLDDIYELDIKEVEHLINPKLDKTIQDLNTLRKYIDYQTSIKIILEFEDPRISGLTKPQKKHMYAREAEAYNVTIKIEKLEVLTHEICHVIDKVATKNQLSKQPSFEPLLSLYKQRHKEVLKTIKQSDDTYEQKAKSLKYWRNPYRNGKVETEIFARFCEYHLQGKETLNFHSKTNTPFDIVCFDIYRTNKQQIDEYFDKVLQEISNKNNNAETDVAVEESHIEFKESLYFIDALDNEITL